MTHGRVRKRARSLSAEGGRRTWPLKKSDPARPAFPSLGSFRCPSGVFSRDAGNEGADIGVAWVTARGQLPANAARAAAILVYQDRGRVVQRGFARRRELLDQDRRTLIEDFETEV